MTAQEQDAPDANRYISWAPPGHMYSPIPDYRRIEQQAKRIFAPQDQLPGIDLRQAEQLEIFTQLAPLANGLGLAGATNESRRYRTDNLNYGIGDALMLGSFLRFLRPKQYLEVGSGWSTALTMDVNDHFLDGAMRVSAIEPYPELLKTLCPGDDIELIDQPVEDVPLHYFESLEANDVLFIDSTHVVKIGSDTHFLLTQVLPRVKAGVYVHIHDVFWPFEYPRSWIDEGRAWNEDYMLHAFLLFNAAFEIVFFNSWFANQHRPVIQHALPSMLDNPGGALWLRRVK